ncbi:MAG TPA: T9SS type A sorting domain-containing protein, partial [Bacteroidales bacterium]|nr:T9SS type A sorting domain-containing protein [Bacteroidales bacterium]
ATNPLMTVADDRQAASRVNVHPNPTTGGVEVYAFGSPAGSSAPLELLTISGTIVGHYDWNGKSAHLDLSPLPKGVYLLKVRTAERTEMKKIILQ